MGGAWQDEQTGGQSSLIWENLTEPSSKTKLFGTNGTHVDSLVAELNRWYEFLEFYVARRIPHVPAGVRALAPAIFAAATGISGVQLEPDRFTQYPTYAAALAAYEAEPPVRILLENGAGDPNNLGAPFGTYEVHFPSWPPPNAVATTWWFQADQKLWPAKPTDEGQRRPRARRRTSTTRPRSRPPTSTAASPTSGPRIPTSTGACSRSARRSRSTASRSAQTTAHRRSGQRRLVVALDRARHRPRSHAHRAATRRPRGLRAERLAARVAPRPRRRAFDRARTGAPRHVGIGCALAARTVRERARRAVPVRAHLPRRFAHPHQRRGAGRQPSVLGVRRSSRERHGHQRHRALGIASLASWCCPSSRIRPQASRPRTRRAARCAANRAGRSCRTARPPRLRPTSTAGSR